MVIAPPHPQPLIEKSGKGERAWERGKQELNMHPSLYRTEKRIFLVSFFSGFV